MYIQVLNNINDTESQSFLFAHFALFISGHSTNEYTLSLGAK